MVQARRREAVVRSGVPSVRPPMHLTDLDTTGLQFHTSDEVHDALRSACEANPDVASFEIIGRSEEGRPLVGITMGYGPTLVTLVAGAHADEPVGPETLRLLVLEGLAARDWVTKQIEHVSVNAKGSPRVTGAPPTAKGSTLSSSTSRSASSPTSTPTRRRRTRGGSGSGRTSVPTSPTGSGSRPDATWSSATPSSVRRTGP